ncbi:MAG: metallophosphoesterase [Armatimonadetes bacterium]|nr:metallophosphoesterase [Armatimonadota bacterium]
MLTRLSHLVFALLLLLAAACASADFSFVQISDTHVGVKQTAYDARFAEVMRQINELNPAFVIHTGDALQSWSPENAALFKEMTAKLSAPIHIAPGNHDIQNLRKSTPSQASESISAWKQAFEYDRAAFERDGCVFIALDSNLYNTGFPAERAQLTWLRSELRKAKGKRIFIIEHSPLFLTNPGDPNGDYFEVDEPARGVLLKLFREHKVEVVLTGHVHRFLESHFDGISFISTPATSFSCSEDKGLTGYRVFSVSSGGFTTRFVDLRRTGAPPEMTGQ